MPRSTRSKSHKERKHSSKDAREHSESEEDVNLKDRKGKESKEDGSLRVSSSSEKRKLVSQSLDSKDSTTLHNGDLPEDYSASKRRKERSDATGSDRWNGGTSAADKEVKVEISRLDEKGLKSRVLVDSKSKSSRRHESSSDKKEIVVEIDDVKRSSNTSSKVDSKSKSEKDLARKEVHYYKDAKENKDVKDKEHGGGGGDKERKTQDVRRERSVERVAARGTVSASEETRKPAPHSGADRSVKRDVGNTDWQMHDELRNHELEKELEKRMRRRRDGSDEKDKHQDDLRDANERRLSTRDDRVKNERHKDEKKNEKIKDDGYRDKYREDIDRDRRSRDERHREERSMKDHTSDRSDARHARDDSKIIDRHRKSKTQNSDRDDSSRFDDRDIRYKDVVGKKRSSEDEDHNDVKPRSSKEQRYEVEKKSNSAKVEMIADRGRSQSRLADVDHTVSSSRRKSSPSSGGHFSKDQYRYRDDSSRFDDRDTRYKDVRGKKRSSEDEDHSDLKLRSSKEQRYEGEKKPNSAKIEMIAERGRSHSRLGDADHTVSSRRKSSPSSGGHFTKDQYRHSSRQAESKYKDSVSEDRTRTNVTPREHGNVSGVGERIPEFRPTEKPRPVAKPIYKEENQLRELSANRSPVSDAEASPVPHKDKSHSSASIERRHSNRMPARRSLDVDETGRRSFGSKEGRDYSVNDDWSEKLGADESQADDTVSVSSSLNRNSHLPSGPSSHLPPPPPFRSGVDSPSVFGSLDEDSRGKSNNRYKRTGDSNVGRGHGNAWKNVPNWPPVTNGFVFPHGPPPAGFHAMMPQFPGPPMFGVRPAMDMNQTGVSYHIPDAGHGRPFGWRNPVDEVCQPHMHGWDGSNSVFRDDSHMHGRSDWDQNRHIMSERGWESNMELWKGQNNGANIEFTNTSHKADNLMHPPIDEVRAGKLGQRSRNDRGRPSSQVESIEIKPDDVPPSEVPVAGSPLANFEKMRERSRISNDIGAQSFHIYLSKLDISADLTHPELYKKCMNLLDMGKKTTDEDKTKHSYLEGCGEAGIKISNAIRKGSVFPTVQDTVFQRAMALYKKQADEERVKFQVSSFLGSAPKIIATTERADAGPKTTGQKQEPIPTFDGPEGRESAAFPEGENNPEPDLTSATMVNAEQIAAASINVTFEQLVSASKEEKVEEPVSAFVNVKVELEQPKPTSEHGKEQETALHYCEVEEPIPTCGDAKADELAPSLDSNSDMEIVEAVKNHSPLHASHFTAGSPSNADKIMASYRKDEEMAFSNTIMCGPLGFTDGSEACEAMMPESIECRSLNLSRIHSPESTH